MNMTILAMLASATMAVPPPDSHIVRLDHQGRALDVSYQGRLKVETRQVGIAPPTRMSTERCHWTAELTIERSVTPAGGADPVLRRSLPSDKKMSGSRSGGCKQNKAAITRELAGKHAILQAQLREVADRDQRALLAELTAHAQLAAN